MLRHSALQAVRDAVGAEAAQAIAGHSRIDTTEIYAKASEERAVLAAQHTPNLPLINANNANNANANNAAKALE